MTPRFVRSLVWSFLRRVVVGGIAVLDLDLVEPAPFAQVRDGRLVVTPQGLEPLGVARAVQALEPRGVGALTSASVARSSRPSATK